MMSKIKQLLLVIMLMPLLDLASEKPPVVSAPKPNIIIFLVDDMGLMDTSVPMLTDKDGNPKRYPLNDWYRTPNMERLAAQGIRFSNFYSHNVCSPTRISIMTGQNAARHRTTDYIDAYQNNRDMDNKKYPLAINQRVPPEWNWEGLGKENVTLPSILRQLGYTTIHIGKGHFAPDKHEGTDPRNIGFDVNIGGSAIGHPKSYYGKRGYGKGTDCAVPHLEKYHGTDTFLTEALTLEAKTKMDKALAAEKPFFLYMSHYAVHAPFNSDPRFAQHYRGRGKSAAAQAYATLIEGMDKLYGHQMNYDMDSGTGLVHEGSTKFMDGYYNGETIAKAGEDVLKVWNSIYTTCDLKVPHYHGIRTIEVYLIVSAFRPVFTSPIVNRVPMNPFRMNAIGLTALVFDVNDISDIKGTSDRAVRQDY